MRVKKIFAGACATAVMTAGVAGPAAAATQNQDGLVNVAVGDVTVQDVNVGVAAGIAANACNLVDVNQVAVLASQVDQTGNPATVCTTGAQTVRLLQN